MIKSFTDRETELIWSGRQSRRLPADMQAIALRKLRMLHAALAITDLRVPPGNPAGAFEGKLGPAVFDPDQ